MKASELFKKAKSLMFESPSSNDFKNDYIEHINFLLYELFNENNALREFNGKEVLTEVPMISNEDDEIMYEPRMLYQVLPLGLAARLIFDDDLGKWDVYNRDYLNARTQVQPLCEAVSFYD